MTEEDIARVCHEANRAFCVALGDLTQVPWADAPTWQRDSAIHGVEHHISNLDSPASHSHESWLKEKVDTGWVYGEVKDAVKKTHPCIVPFDQLPREQQMKDVLFAQIVRTLVPLLDK